MFNKKEKNIFWSTSHDIKFNEKYYYVKEHYFLNSKSGIDAVINYNLYLVFHDLGQCDYNSKYYGIKAYVKGKPWLKLADGKYFKDEDSIHTYIKNNLNYKGQLPYIFFGKTFWFKSVNFKENFLDKKTGKIQAESYKKYKAMDSYTYRDAIREDSLRRIKNG